MTPKSVYKYGLIFSLLVVGPLLNVVTVIWMIPSYRLPDNMVLALAIIVGLLALLD